MNCINMFHKFSTENEYFVQIAESKNAIAGPRKLVKHKTQAQKRKEIKHAYNEDKKKRGVDTGDLIGEFLSVMGHNVITSTMIGRNTDLTESQDINNIVNTSQEATNTSNWQVSDETQEEIELDFGENPYSGRRVGVSRKQQ